MIRKLLLFLLFLLFLFIIRIDVYASSFTSSIIGEDTFHNQITLEVKVDNYDDFSSACNGLCGFVGTLVYDNSKLELMSINALNDFNLSQGKSLVLYRNTGIKEGSSILTMTFRNKGMNHLDKTNITISNVVGSDGDKDIPSQDILKTIQFIDNSANKNSSSKNQNSSTSKMNNCNLSSITLDHGDIDFSKDILIYDVVVDYDVSKISIDGVVEDDSSTIEGIGKYNLSVGLNVVELRVTSQDGSSKTYTINITRANDGEILKTDISDSKTRDYPILYIFFIGFLLCCLVAIFIVRSRKKK